VLFVSDFEHADSDDAILVDFVSDGIHSPEFKIERSNGKLARAAVSVSWIELELTTDPAAVRIRIDGDDDLAVDSIVVASPGFRSTAIVGEWIGPDHENPGEFLLESR
jgi:hypothetical protein